jgi:pimeloyl-ACP methyl ester carboxylesterase
LDALAVLRAAVIAASGGGQCALQFALRHPGRCAALVMISACSATLTEPVPFRFRLMTFLARFLVLAAAIGRRGAKDPQASVRRATMPFFVSKYSMIPTRARCSALTWPV